MYILIVTPIKGNIAKIISPVYGPAIGIATSLFWIYLAENLSLQVCCEHILLTRTIRCNLSIVDEFATSLL